MKKIGIILCLTGFLFTLITTFSVLVNEHVEDPKIIEMANLKIHLQVWEPMVGTLLIIVGAGMYKVAKKERTKNRIEFPKYVKY